VIWKIIGWIVFIWLVIWVANHSDAASLDVHNIWHAFFGSAG
jgi:hypothetical protein